MADTRQHSKGEINRAGERLVAWWASDENNPPDDVVECYFVVSAFRGSFTYPLTKVSVGMRQFVARESNEVIVSQRLKRMPTIIGKLIRYPDMKLARMEDIGGCRAILPGGTGEIAGVLRRIRRNWSIVRVRDYIAEPKETGYRAVHVIVSRDDHRIEIQLRTPRQHEWAVEVDKAASRLRLPQLKDGVGPPELVRYFERAAYGLALEEEGREVDEEFTREFNELREQVRPHFQRR